MMGASRDGPAVRRPRLPLSAMELDNDFCDGGGGHSHGVRPPPPGLIDWAGTPTVQVKREGHACCFVAEPKPDASTRLLGRTPSLLREIEMVPNKFAKRPPQRHRPPVASEARPAAAAPGIRVREEDFLRFGDDLELLKRHQLRDTPDAPPPRRRHRSRYSIAAVVPVAWVNRERRASAPEAAAERFTNLARGGQAASTPCLPMRRGASDTSTGSGSGGARVTATASQGSLRGAGRGGEADCVVAPSQTKSGLRVRP